LGYFIKKISTNYAANQKNIKILKKKIKKTLLSQNKQTLFKDTNASIMGIKKPSF
jgi:hypothetical protein